MGDDMRSTDDTEGQGFKLSEDPASPKSEARPSRDDMRGTDTEGQGFKLSEDPASPKSKARPSSDDMRSTDDTEGQGFKVSETEPDSAMDKS